MKNHLPNTYYAEQFPAQKAHLSGAGLAWLEDIRAKAMEAFSQSGLPGPRVEEWKYTNLAKVSHTEYAVADQAGSEAEILSLYEKACLKDLKASEVVFVNGRYHADLSTKSLPDQIKLTVFSQDPEALQPHLINGQDQNPLRNLNRALMMDGLLIEVADGVHMEQPLHMIHLVTQQADHQAIRGFNRIILQKNAHMSLVESFGGADQCDYWSHMISDVTLEDGAQLTHTQFQLQGDQAIHMAEIKTDLADNARFQQVSLQLGSALSRTEIHSALNGEEACLDLKGAYVGGDGQCHDIVTTTGHNVPNCQSNQLYRGVMDKGGKAAFQGKVVVARDAQKTNADQSCKNLLLDRKAEINAKPELLIYADDVKCTHGATVGELDKDQMFYLKSRGLDEMSAKSLLVEAFVAEVFDGLENKVLKEAFKSHAAGWLSTTLERQPS